MFILVGLFIMKESQVNVSQIIKEWVNAYTADMVSWAYYKTSHREVAKDLVQETFIAAFQSFDSFQQRSQPKTWLYSILKNKIIDYHRKNYRAVVISFEEFGDEQSTFLFSRLFDHEGEWKHESKPKDWIADGIEILDDPDFNRVLSGCIGKLPSGWNAAIQLKFLEEKEPGIICQELGVSTTNYWQIIHRAKLQLRACLEIKWFKK